MTEEPQQKFNLVCSVCGHVIAKAIDDDMRQFMQAGHCNWVNCTGKLGWKLV